MSKKNFSKPNPFESNTPKQKFKILNRTIPGTKAVNNAKSQSKAVSKRKKSLLVDLNNINKDNSFVDHRFGENRKTGEGLTSDDKYLERFQRERLRQLRQYKKKHSFSVEDSGDQLTHMGQSLGSVISNLPGAGAGKDEGSDFEDDGKVSYDEVQVSHFGGGKFEEDKKKIVDKAIALTQYPDPTPEQRAKMSKHEIMIDLLRKAKFFKMQKQASATEQNEMAENIDAVYQQIRGLMQFNERHDAMGQTTLKNSKFAAIGMDGKPLLPTDEADFDEFASLALQLQFEKKALPSDRLKSAEEVAKENREKLLQLEKLRQRRMNPDNFKDDDDDEEEQGADLDDEFDDPNRKLSLAERRKKRRDEIKQAKRALKASEAESTAVQKANGELDDDEEEDAEEDEDEDDEDEDMEDNDEEDGMGMEEDTEMKDEVVTNSLSKKPAKSGLKSVSYDEDNLAIDEEFLFGSDDEEDEIKAQSKKAKKSVHFGEDVKIDAPRKRGIIDVVMNDDDDEENPLPYVFDAPKNYKEFSKLLATRGTDTLKAIADHETIVQRLCTLYNIKAGVENQAKMETLYRCLFRHLRVVCEEESMRIGTTESSRVAKSGMLPNEKSTTFLSSNICSAKLDFITRQLFELSQMMPRYAAKTNRDFVEAVRTAIHDRAATNAEAGLTEELQKADPSNLYVPTLRSDTLAAHEIFCLKVLTKIYPVTDYRHNITTPIFILFAESLATLPIRGGRDIISGLVVVSMLLEFTQESKRYIPEILSFLHAILIALFDLAPTVAATRARSKAAKEKNGKSDSVEEDESTSEYIAVVPRNIHEFEYLLHPTQKNILPSSSLCKNLDIHAKRISYLFSTDGEKTGTFEDKIPFSLLFLPHNNFPVFKSQAFLQSVLVNIVKLVHITIKTYDSLESLPEMLSPIYAVVQSLIDRQIVPDNMSDLSINAATYSSLPADCTVYERFNALLENIRFHSKRIQRTRKPLTKFATVEAIAQHTPQFDENFNPNKDKDPNVERAEQKKLVKEVARARKSAIREVRRDTRFIAAEKEKIQAKAADARLVEQKRVWAQFDAENRDSNILANVSRKKTKKMISEKRERGK